MRKLLSVLSSTLQGGVRGGLLLLLLVASVSAIYASDTQVMVFGMILTVTPRPLLLLIADVIMIVMMANILAQ